MNSAKKILFCATVDYHFKAFHLPSMKWFKDQGWKVDVAAQGTIQLPYADEKYHLPIQRSPFRLSNIKAYIQLKKIIRQNQYAIIHCHTPLGGVLARMAARGIRKQGTKVIYTAHGFHFCKGSSIIHWLIYYPVEKYLARHTDTLITINQEDYHLATTHQFKTKEIKHVPGVGVDTERFKPTDEEDKKRLRESFGYGKDELLLFNAGEFNKNKNQQFLLHSMVPILQQMPHARLILAGEGVLLGACRQLAESLGISKHVTFLGFTKQVDILLSLSDIAVAASYREGLPVNVMEAMACGLPVVAVANRGHRELVHDHVNGRIMAKFDADKFAKMVLSLADRDLRQQFGRNGRHMVLDKYSAKQIMRRNSEIYQNYMHRRGEITWNIP